MTDRLRATLYDPTSELEPLVRRRLAPPSSLSEKVVGLMEIGKRRSDEFMDYVQEELALRGIAARRFAKPTNARRASREILEEIARSADVVVEGLAD